MTLPSTAEEDLQVLMAKFRLPKVSQILHYFWFLSHTVTLIGMVVHLAKLLGKSPNQRTIPNWDMAIEISAVITYSIVTYRRYASVISSHLAAYDEDEEIVIPTTIPFSEVLKTENAHLLAFSLLWIFTESNVVKLFPFAIYSFLNLSNYLLNDVFPAYQISAALRPLMSYLENPLLLTAAHLDGIVLVILVKECIRIGTAYPVLLYSLIWILRVESSEASRCSLYTILTIFDYLILQEYNPESLRSGWSKLRGVVTILVPLTKLDREDIHSIYNYIEQLLPGASHHEKDD